MTVYIAIDGNDTGKHLEKYLLSNDVEKVRSFSNALDLQIKYFRDAVLKTEGDILMCGGDNILGTVKAEDIPELCQKIKNTPESEMSFSVGIGNSPRNSYLALKYAKSLHKDVIAFDGESFKDYDENMITHS